MNNNLDSIKTLCKLVSESFDLAIFLISPNGKVIFEHLNQQSLNPLYENEKENLFNTMNFDPKHEYSFPVIIKTNLSEKYIMISISKNDIFEGTVLIGPSVSYSLSDERINDLINNTRAFPYREKIYNYYNSIPYIKHEKLINIGIIAFNMFNNILLSTETVISKNRNLINFKDNDKEGETIISKSLQMAPLQHNRLFERKVLEIVKEGRIEELRNLSILNDEEDASILSKSSYVRSIKNHIITLISLVSVSAIEGGIDHEIAIILRDNLILQLEELNSVDKIRNLAKTVLYTFTEKVLQSKNEHYSKTIITCRNYVYKHVYEEINHDDIANMIELSPKYLSALFKKEVGITLSEYIQQTKIDEAKNLLAYSTNTISDISSLLNFSDQSYFTKIFKKIAGVTPKVYKDRHHLL